MIERERDIMDRALGTQVSSPSPYAKAQGIAPGTLLALYSHCIPRPLCGSLGTKRWRQEEVDPGAHSVGSTYWDRLFTRSRET